MQPPDLPISGMLVDYLGAFFLHGYKPVAANWQDQVSEELVAPEWGDLDKTLNRLLRDERAVRVVQSVVAAYRADRAHETLFAGLPIAFVVGPPRTGGTYIIKEMWKAQGVDPEKVHFIFHDSFPDLVEDDPWKRRWELCQMAAACRLAKEKHNLTWVPKKASAALIDPFSWGGLFPHARWVPTERKEANILRSITDKVGHHKSLLPGRTGIETHCYASLLYAGHLPEEIAQWDHSKALRLAIRWMKRQTYKVPGQSVEFGDGTYQFIKSFREKYGSKGEQSEFKGRE